MASADTSPYTITVIGVPVLTSPTAVTIRQDSMDIAVSTDQAVGTLYWIADKDHMQPSASQIALGLKQDGQPAQVKGSAMAQNTGVLGPYTVNSFMPEDVVYFWFTQSDGYTSMSDVVGSNATLLEANLNGETDSVYFGETAGTIPADHETSDERTANVERQSRTRKVE